jgi:CBS-domain-containing membrane protein
LSALSALQYFGNSIFYPTKNGILPLTEAAGALVKLAAAGAIVKLAVGFSEPFPIILTSFGASAVFTTSTFFSSSIF